MRVVFILALILHPAFSMAQEAQPRAVRLTEVNYRKRLSLKFGVPLIGKIRLRPAIEYRYKPRIQRATPAR